MARDRDRDESTASGVSLSTKDAIESGGLFGPGPAVMKEVRFADFEYKKKGQTRGTVVPVLLVTFERDGEERLQPYGVGSGWKVSKDGLSLIPRNGQAGLPNSCNAFYFLSSLEDAGMPADWLRTPDQLDGTAVELLEKPIKRDFGKDGGGEKEKKILVVSAVEDAPWEAGGKKKPAGGRAVAPKGKPAPARDDDDEDEAPAPKAAKGKPNGKVHEAEPDADTEAIDEEAIEAVLGVVAKGKVTVGDLEEQVRKLLKGHPQRNVIAARCVDEEFLDQERGWSYNPKKQTVEAD